MTLAYRFFLFLYAATLRLLAAAGHAKARAWVRGRQAEAEEFPVLPPGPRIWMHCSSLGEFEQGRPLLEALGERYDDLVIVLTFFSPSGYEVRKNYALAHTVRYLPLDGPRAARQFLDAVQPAAAFFVKYEYWHYYLDELSSRRIPVFGVASVFRRNQVFFRWYGGFFRRMLRRFTHFFVQNEQSAGCLADIGIRNVTVCGDTRFDRVLQVAGKAVAVPALDRFAGGGRVLVAGSTWPEDEALLAAALPSLGGWRLLVAPHDVHRESLARLQRLFPDHALLSKLEAPATGVPPVVIVDSVGLLSSLYRYGSAAFVGGGFGKGIHNVLEAAVYGIPVFFGPRYERFAEAVDLVRNGGAFRVTTAAEFADALNGMTAGVEPLQVAGRKSADYVSGKSGATGCILNTLQRGAGGGWTIRSGSENARPASGQGAGSSPPGN
jgi:3-deoxy-D-manno-octulosonic-acid transferase